MHLLKSNSRSFYGLLVLLCTDFTQSCESCASGKKDLLFLPSLTTQNGSFLGCDMFRPGSFPSSLQTEGEFLAMQLKMIGIITDRAWTSGYRDKAGEPFRWRFPDNKTAEFTFARWAFDTPPADHETGCVTVAATAQGLAFKLEQCSRFSNAICEFCLPN